VCGKVGDNDCRILDALVSMHEFLLSRKSSQGYTPDPRDSLLEPKSEFYRLVPCMQAQGYLNLYACTGEKVFLEEACDRLDFVALHLGEALSGTCYDGQLGWAFLDAYKFTCNKSYLEIGLNLAGKCRPDEGRFLNWGMLAAVNLLRASEITGATVYLDDARTIIAQTLPFQNTDGSFPHQAVAGQRNLPYTSWLAYELVTYQEGDPALPQLGTAIDRSGVFLARQLNLDGSPRYDWDSLIVVRIPDPMCVQCATLPSEECESYCAGLCPGDPESRPCWCIRQPAKDCPYIDTLTNITYYDEEARDYDVRGWTSELPSTAFVLDRTGRTQAKWKVLEFLFSLQNADGSFPDKWGFVPTSNQRMYVFASETHSVIRTSDVFFYLSGLLRKPGSFDRHPDASSLAAATFTASPGETAKQSSASHSEVAARAREFAGAERPSGAKEHAGEHADAVQNMAPTLVINPNPLFGAASISYSIREGSPCRISIVDVSGRLVKELVPAASGEGLVRWDGRDQNGKRVSPGVYFVMLASEAERASEKIIVLEGN